MRYYKLKNGNKKVKYSINLEQLNGGIQINIYLRCLIVLA